MTAEEKLRESGYEDITVLSNFSYDSALIGVSQDNRAVYDYDKMVQWIVDTQGWTEMEAMEWIDYNTIRALPYMGEGAPIVVFGFYE